MASYTTLTKEPIEASYLKRYNQSLTNSFIKANFLETDPYSNSYNQVIAGTSVYLADDPTTHYSVSFLMRPISYTATTPRIYQAHNSKYKVFYPFDTTGYNIIDLIPSPVTSYSYYGKNWQDNQNYKDACIYRFEYPSTGGSYIINNVAWNGVSSDHQMLGPVCQANPYYREVTTAYDPNGIVVMQYNNGCSTEFFISLKTYEPGRKIKFKLYYCVTNLRQDVNQPAQSAASAFPDSVRGNICIAESNLVQPIADCRTSTPGQYTAGVYLVTNSMQETKYDGHVETDIFDGYGKLNPNMVICHFRNNKPDFISQDSRLEELPGDLLISGTNQTPLEYITRSTTNNQTIYSNFKTGYIETSYTTTTNYHYLIIGAGIDGIGRNSGFSYGRAVGLTKLVLGISFDEFHT